jgi:hypothetical protein
MSPNEKARMTNEARMLEEDAGAAL